MPEPRARFAAASAKGRVAVLIAAGAVAALGQAPFNLWPLTILSLGLNDLRGPIPPEWGNLAQLRLLYLPMTLVSGTLPAALGNLTELLNDFDEPIARADAATEGEANSSNAEFLNLAIEENVRQTIADLLDQSEVISDLVDSGDLLVVGGVYDLWRRLKALLRGERFTAAHGEAAR